MVLLEMGGMSVKVSFRDESDGPLRKEKIWLVFGDTTRRTFLLRWKRVCVEKPRAVICRRRGQVGSDFQGVPNRGGCPSWCLGLPRALSSLDSDEINQTATVGWRERLEPMSEAVRKELDT